MAINTTSKEMPTGDGNPTVGGANNGDDFPTEQRPCKAFDSLRAVFAREGHGTDLAHAQAPVQHIATSRQGSTTGAKNGTAAARGRATVRLKPKGPVRKNTTGQAVATPTEKRGFVVLELVQPALVRAGMVYGHGGGHPQGRPHGLSRVLNHHAHPLRVRTRRVVSESRQGAKTMTNVTRLVRKPAPVTSYTDTTDPQAIGLHIAAENALAGALQLLRAADCDAAKVQAATGRAIRAATLLKRASAAHALAVCTGLSMSTTTSKGA